MSTTTTDSPNNELPGSSRRLDLDRAKGLGILLVVLGHVVAREPPSGNDWYVALKSFIYLFHMPFFMYLSGYVTFATGGARLTSSRWKDAFAKRAYRLLVPFIAFGLIIIVGKLFAGRFLSVDNLPTSTTAAIIDLLWNTDNSPATSVWYVVVLFLLCVATPVLMKLLGGKSLLLLLLSLGLYVAPVPHVMYLDRAARFFVFFVLGGIAAELGQKWMALVDKSTLIWLLSLLVVGTGFLVTGHSFYDNSALLICGCLSMPSLHGLVRKPFAENSSTLLMLGNFSFVIYLLNTPCIGVVKGLGLKLITWDGGNFLLYFPLLMAAGVAGPVLIKKHILKRIPAADKLTN